MAHYYTVNVNADLSSITINYCRNLLFTCIHVLSHIVKVTALRKLHQSGQSTCSVSSVTVENRASARRPKSSSASLSREDEPQAKKAKLHRRQYSMFSSDAAKKKWKLMEKRVRDQYTTVEL